MANKIEILHELISIHPALAHEVAQKHGGVLYDLTCNVCKNRIENYFAQVSGRPNQVMYDEWRLHICPKCGVRGDYTAKPTPKPTPTEVKSGQVYMAKLAEQKRQTELADIDAQIAALQKRRDVLAPPQHQDIQKEGDEIHAEPTAAA